MEGDQQLNPTVANSGQQPRGAVFLCQERLSPGGGPEKAYLHRPDLPPKRGVAIYGGGGYANTIAADQFKTLPQPPKSFRSFNNVTGGVGGGNCNVMNNKTLPRKLNNTSSNGGSSSTFKNGGSGKLTHLNNPLYVSQNSVAVMTSPTFSSQMGRTSFTTNSSLSDTDSSVSASQVTAVPRGVDPPSRCINSNPLISYPVLPPATVSDPLRPSNGTGQPPSASQPPVVRGILTNRNHGAPAGLYDPVIPNTVPTTPSSAINPVRRTKPLFGGCCIGGSLWEGRSCAERFIFGLLIALIVSVFVIGGLICLQVVTGSAGAGGTLGRAFSALVFAGEGLGLGGVSGVGSVPENLRFHPDKDINILIDDTDLEIVRIKTTEEHKVQGSLKTESIVRTKRVCVTRECSDLSRRILQSLDPEADPCHSFYSFSCGGWMERNQPPPGRMVHSVMSLMRDRVDEKLRGLIEGIHSQHPDPINRQLKTFYDSCMAVNEIRAKGSIPAFEFLHSNFSVFLENIHGRRRTPSSAPDLTISEANEGDGEQFSESPADQLTDLLLALLKVNGSPLIDVSLDLSPRNASQYMGVIRVPQRAALLPRLITSRRDAAFLNRWVKRRRKRNSRSASKIVPRKEIFNSFQTALNAQRVAGLVKTAETMGILDTTTEATKQTDIDEILGFLASLEKVLPSEKDLKKNQMENRVYNEYNVEELQASFGYINWTRLLGGLFPNELLPHEILLVHDPVYLRRLGRTIALFDKRVIWKSLLVLYAKDVLRDLVTVHHSGQPRWKYCSQVTSMVFGEALSRLYLSSFSPDDRKKIAKEVEAIFRVMKKHLIQKIAMAKWMRNFDTKQRSIDKVERVYGSLMGSDIFFNHTFLEERYAGVSMGPDFFSNVMTMFVHFRTNIYRLVNGPADPAAYTWNLISFPFTVNAFHLQQLNSIVIPLGLMGEAHFSLRVPKYLNVGSLGLTLAHEMLHSLDSTGRGFDSRGVLANDFWDYETRKTFANVSQCINNQYREHFKRPIRVDSRTMMLEVDELTLNENMCDVDGVNVAASAFEDLYESSAVSSAASGDLVYLPNNPYSPQQLFFINTAQAYCAHVTPVSYVLYLELDEHSPNPERVDGMMMNSRDFNQAFGCPLGSRMNPQQKCTVWT